MLTIKEIFIDGYEKLIEGIDPECGLHCFIAIHSTALGPALGGTRIHPYHSPEDAIHDVLRLAKGMTYKSAAAQDGLGGGKSVIIAHQKDKTPKLLAAFAEVVNYLEGDYIAAEDVGSTIADMSILRQYTPFVAALPGDRSSGDPSRFTAWGVLRGIQAVAFHLWGSISLKNKKIAIQGLGSVGGKLAEALFWEGADLIVCDINQTLAHQYAHDTGAINLPVDDFIFTECDILVPCAFGGIINANSIPKLRCKAVAGSANNQLDRPESGALLLERGILYAPDLIINSGGIINAAAEFDEEGYNPKIVRNKVDYIYDQLLQIFNTAENERKPTNIVADEIAENNLSLGVGKRKHPIQFKI